MVRIPLHETRWFRFAYQERMVQERIMTTHHFLDGLPVVPVTEIEKTEQYILQRIKEESIDSAMDDKAARDDAWERGYEEGYDQGLRDGHDEGYDSGYEIGYDEAEATYRED